MKTTLILPIPHGSTPLVGVHDVVREKEPLFKRQIKSVERTIHLARILKVPAGDISKYYFRGAYYSGAYCSGRGHANFANSVSCTIV
jgi:hypothetical protein